MEQIYHIRYEYNISGKSLRQIARETGHDRKTVKKYVSQNDFNQEKKVKRKRKRKSDAYRAQIRTWLIEDERAPRKQRHTAHRIYLRLKEESKKSGKPLAISERTVRRLVAELRRELVQNELVCLPLIHPAGEAQVDFGKTVFFENGQQYTGSHLALTFPHSDAKYTQLFKGENFECLAEGLINIFEYVGGVPTCIRFDNMSAIVKQIKALGGRELTDSFRRLQCHFGFSSNFCNPGKGHEKGSVENYVGYSRRNYFVPVPKFKSLKEYNKELLQHCDNDLEREHYKLGRKVSSLFKEDKAHFRALPRYTFEACRYVVCKTDQYGMCRFEKNRYSTAGNLRSCEVTLKVSANQITVLAEDGSPIVRHPRLYGEKQESMRWSPYLHVLAKRPNALRYSGFFEKLPPPLKDFLNKSEPQDKKKVLTCLAKRSEEKDLEVLVASMSEALEENVKDADDLIAAFDFLINRPCPLPKNAVPEALPETPEYELSFDAYALLLDRRER